MVEVPSYAKCLQKILCDECARRFDCETYLMAENGFFERKEEDVRRRERERTEAEARQAALDKRRAEDRARGWNGGLYENYFELAAECAAVVKKAILEEKAKEVGQEDS